MASVATRGARLTQAASRKTLSRSAGNCSRITGQFGGVIGPQRFPAERLATSNWTISWGTRARPVENASLLQPFSYQEDRGLIKLQPPMHWYSMCPIANEQRGADYRHTCYTEAVRQSARASRVWET